MQALEINWVARPRPVTTIGLLLALVGLLCAIGVTLDYMDADAEQTALLARQNRALPGDAPKKRSYVEAEPLTRDAALSAAQIDTQLQLPWNEFLQAIESSSMPSVALLGVEAQGSTHVLHLVGEAKEIEDVLAYVKKLRASPALQDVFMVGQEEKLVNAVKVIRFTVDATWGAAL
jgi:hypothetical protein